MHQRKIISLFITKNCFMLKWKVKNKKFKHGFSCLWRIKSSFQSDLNHIHALDKRFLDTNLTWNHSHAWKKITYEDHRTWTFCTWIVRMHRRKKQFTFYHLKKFPPKKSFHAKVRSLKNQTRIFMPSEKYRTCTNLTRTTHMHRRKLKKL
jgi:hypothetical protein